MEPLSIVVISAAAGGVAGKLIEKAWERGEKWLSKYQEDHHPKAQEKGIQNALDFLNYLALKIGELEKKADNPKIFKSRMRTCLEDPDFSVLLKNAILTSSRTKDKEKHEILARIVSERLNCDSESLIALTSFIACEAVGYLTPNQLRLLGIAELVFDIRTAPFPPKIPPEQFDKWYTQWLDRMLLPQITGVKATRLDWIHLMSVSCIKYEPIITRDLNKVLSPKDESYKWNFEEYINNYETGKSLNELWNKGIKSITLTSAGTLIGIYVNDILTESKTIIDWK